MQVCISILCAQDGGRMGGKIVSIDERSQTRYKTMKRFESK